MGLRNKGRQKEAGGTGRLALLCATNPRGESTRTPLVDMEWLSWVESLEGPSWAKFMSKKRPDLLRRSLLHGPPEAGGVNLEEGRGREREELAHWWNV